MSTDTKGKGKKNVLIDVNWVEFRFRGAAMEITVNNFHFYNNLELRRYYTILVTNSCRESDSFPRRVLFERLYRFNIMEINFLIAVSVLFILVINIYVAIMLFILS